MRLPKAFRFEGITEAFFERNGNRVALHPTRRPSIERLIAVLNDFKALPDNVWR